MLALNASQRDPQLNREKRQLMAHRRQQQQHSSIKHKPLISGSDGEGPDLCFWRSNKLNLRIFKGSLVPHREHFNTCLTKVWKYDGKPVIILDFMNLIFANIFTHPSFLLQYWQFVSVNVFNIDLHRGCRWKLKLFDKSDTLHHTVVN